MYAPPMDTAEESQERADWDMSPYFDGVGTDDYKSFCGALATDMQALAIELPTAGLLDAASGQTWSALLLRLEENDK